MLEFCEYNPFTLTGRPSNHFNNVNYAALNKTDGTRKRFVSRNKSGFLVEIDLSGFHLYLLYTIIGKEIPENIYNELSKYYPEGVEAKEYTFKQIYGGIDYDLLEIEPFRSINKLCQQIWLDYKTDNLKTFLFDRKIPSKNLPGLTQWKLFNYMLQNLETEFNAIILEKLNKLLRNKETKLILYTYDSFLFDYSPKDTMNVFREIIHIFERVPFHIKVGSNYHELKLIQIKMRKSN